MLHSGLGGKFMLFPYEGSGAKSLGGMSMRYPSWLIGSLVAASLTACGNSATPPRVIAIADMDFDDVAALSFLIAEHKLGRLHLEALIVDNNGAGYPGDAIRHARCLLERTGLGSIPVADGTTQGTNAFPEAIRSFANQILDNVFTGCTQPKDSSAIKAPQFIIDTILSASAPVTLVTSGPLTNVSAALKDARITDRVQGIYTMGGAISVGGNLCCGVPTTFDNTQEFNIWVDPAAAQDVLSFRSGGQTLVPLDATRNVPVTQSFLDRLITDHHTPEADVVAAIGADPGFQASLKDHMLFWWDPLNAVAFVHPEVVSLTAQRLNVVQSGTPQGQVVISKGGTLAQVASHADKNLFEKLFLTVLNTGP